jgi:hypothetical protein
VHHLVDIASICAGIRLIQSGIFGQSAPTAMPCCIRRGRRCRLNN